MMTLFSPARFFPLCVVCVCLTTIIMPGAAYNSRSSESQSFFYSPQKTDPPPDKPRNTSTSTSQGKTTTTQIKKARTGANTEQGLMKKTALVTGSVLCSTLYTPAKALYAAGGTLTGSVVYLMSAGQSTTAASNIISRSTRGDWFVRPSHLSGDQDLHFDASPVQKKKRTSKF